MHFGRGLCELWRSRPREVFGETVEKEKRRGLRNAREMPNQPDIVYCMSNLQESLIDWKPVSLPRPVTLRGRTVTLEPLNAERHAAALWRAAHGHDDLWTWLPDGPFASEADLRSAIEAKAGATSAIFLALVPVKTGQAAGYASYMRMEPAQGVIEVGNILLTPALQHTAAATESMYLMAGHIFDHLGYRRYEWKCNAKNQPSRRAAVRLGFTFEGIFRQHMVVKGWNRDTAWYSMLDSEWPTRRKAFEDWLLPANFDADGRQRKGLVQIRDAHWESGATV
jgi:RimJ/RimL family protein N-acetyltransferase